MIPHRVSHTFEILERAAISPLKRIIRSDAIKS